MEPSDKERRLLEAAAWLRSCTPAERAEAAFYADLEGYKARAAKAEADLAAATERAKIAEGDKEVAARHYQGMIDTLRDECADLRTGRRRAKAEQDAGEADLVRVTEERDTLASQLADLQREHDKLQAHADDLYRQASERAKERDAALKRVDKLVTISKIGRGLLGGER